MLVAVVIATFAVSRVEANGPDYRDPATLKQVLADLNEAPDPEIAFATLPTAAQEAVVWALTPTGEEAEESVVYGNAPRSDDMPACRTHVYSKHKTNGLGWKIATYKSWTWWCRLNGKIHGTPDFEPSGKVYKWAKAFWRFKGHDYKQTWFGSGRSYHRDKGRGSFENCTPTKPKVCVVRWTVTINKKQNGSGTQSAW